MKIVLSLLICTIPSQVLAAGGSGHGSPADLISSFVNIALLGAGLLYILIPIMKEHFGSKSKNVKEVMERASVKAKEAQMLMELQKKKIDGVDTEISDLKKDADSEVKSYESQYNKDLELRISKLKEDAGKKIETEKQELANDLNEQLLDAVIANAKKQIKADGNLNSEATNKILQGLK